MRNARPLHNSARFRTPTCGLLMICNLKVPTVLTLYLYESMFVITGQLLSNKVTVVKPPVVGSNAYPALDLLLFLCLLVYIGNLLKLP